MPLGVDLEEDVVRSSRRDEVVEDRVEPDHLDSFLVTNLELGEGALRRVGRRQREFMSERLPVLKCPGPASEPSATRCTTSQQGSARARSESVS